MTYERIMIFVQMKRGISMNDNIYLLELPDGIDSCTIEGLDGVCYVFLNDKIYVKSEIKKWNKNITRCDCIV